VSNPFELSDTIAAVATPGGRGALAVVRLAGPRAHDIAAAVVERFPDRARVAVLSPIRDAGGAELDQAVVLRYDAPASFSGENAVEIITHGGLVVPTTVLGALIAHGARLARPGEFTRRAVLNGKLDILQAEATGDLVNANSRAAQHVAVRQLDGGLSRRVLALRDELIGLEALIAYDIDFPEEDDGPVAPARITSTAARIETLLERLLATAAAGQLVREGALVVLAGAPNVGKSSLFNALLGESRAIVTDIPGTTRDAIEAVVDTPAIPLRLVDTAGLRDARDPVERIGVEISASYVARASAVLACWDDAGSLRAIVSALDGMTSGPVVAVRTKSDLAPAGGDTGVSELLARFDRRASVSAETGDGLASLIAVVTEVVTGEAGTIEIDAPMLTQERHRFAVGRALEELRLFQEAWTTKRVPAPVAAVHLREAITTLEDLIGSVDVEQVLDEVFRRFCVGK
jgi:tRNA modification GTPase